MVQLGYCRCYSPSFSSTAPNNKLTGKGVAWNWGSEQDAAFAALKSSLCVTGLVLRQPDPKRPFVLHTDFSKRGISAVLGQTDDDGREYMIACISRSLNKQEQL
jgi:hypothetical protein